jgi:cobalt-zinc-cadmium efflux system outer membrane protein
MTRTGRLAPRKGFIPLVTWAVWPVILSGCALNQQAASEVTAALEDYKQSQERTATDYVGGGVRPSAPRRDQAGEHPTTEPAYQPSPPRTLREYILLALRENPEIRAAQERARAKAERVPQVTALPDPVLATKSLPEPTRTAEGDNYFILGYQQKLPVPGKLDHAGRMAIEEARAALQQLQETRLRVIADVKRIYYRLYVIDRTIEITHDNQDLLRGLIDVARGQVAAGRRDQEDVLRAQVELSNLDARLVELDQQRKTAVAMLNSTLNRRPDTLVEPPAGFDARTVKKHLDELLRIGGRESPRLRRLAHQIERDRQAVKLARLAYWPDFTIGFEWMQMDDRPAWRPPPNTQTGVRPPAPTLSEDGSDNWAITFGLNLPIWFEKIEAGIREARRQLAASQHEYAAEENRVYAEIDDALARVRAQRELVDIFANTIIPQARQTYEVSRAAYTSGTSDFQFVIDNWQKWLQFTIQYHRALGEVERSIADLEQVLGLSIGELEAQE